MKIKFEVQHRGADTPLVSNVSIWEVLNEYALQYKKGISFESLRYGSGLIYYIDTNIITEKDYKNDLINTYLIEALKIYRENIIDRILI